MARQKKCYCAWCMTKVKPPVEVCDECKPDWLECEKELELVRDKVRPLAPQIVIHRMKIRALRAERDKLDCEISQIEGGVGYARMLELKLCKVFQSHGTRPSSPSNAQLRWISTSPLGERGRTQITSITPMSELPSVRELRVCTGPNITSAGNSSRSTISTATRETRSTYSRKYRTDFGENPMPVMPFAGRSIIFGRSTKTAITSILPHRSVDGIVLMPFGRSELSPPLDSR